MCRKGHRPNMQRHVTFRPELIWLHHHPATDLQAGERSASGGMRIYPPDWMCGPLGPDRHWRNPRKVSDSQNAACSVDGGVE